MSHTAHGFKHGFFSALNRYVAASFFNTPRRRGQEKNQPVLEMLPKTPRNLARERYLAIPTFIRQGKILGL